MAKLFGIWIVGSLLFLHSCKKNEPCATCPPSIGSTEISLSDVSCTETWLKLSFGDANQPRTYVVTRTAGNGTAKEVTSGYLIGSDTLVYDKGLTPGAIYTYTIQRMYDSKASVNSSPLQVKTMDTTSHEMSWTLERFGDGAASSFHDVAIINDTLAYAVGEVYSKDSTGQWDPQPSNVAQWNGKHWTLQKLYANGFPPSIQAIFAVNDHDVWLSPWFHWNGVQFTNISSDPMFFGVGISRMWGNSNALYAVGSNGFIACRGTDGIWTRITSGTTLGIQDIWGNGNEILAVASSPAQNDGSLVLQVNGNSASTISGKGLPWSLTGIWFASNHSYYISGDGIFSKHVLSDSSWISLHQNITTFYTVRVRGNATNDVFLVGAYGEIVHFNGATWRSYRNVTGIDGALGGLAVKGNLVMAVGTEETSSGPRAVVAIGKRNL